MNVLLVKLSTLKKGDRFRLPYEDRVYYKAYYSRHAGAWACLHDGGSRIQKNFEPSRLVVFLRHA